MNVFEQEIERRLIVYDVIRKDRDIIIDRLGNSLNRTTDPMEKLILEKVIRNLYEV